MSPVAVKICGLGSADALAGALEGGARRVGFVFYPPSPRNIAIDRAAALVARVPRGVEAVGVFVEPDDALLDEVLGRAPLSALQLHGRETPRRVAQLRARYGLPVVKAVQVADEDDLAQAGAYAPVADRLMFDARPPAGAALPGGNGVAFDWRLLAGRTWPRPWVLSGGLTPDNVARAVAETGAREVDVSSGVESAPGVKDPARIAAFFAALGGAPGGVSSAAA